MTKILLNATYQYKPASASKAAQKEKPQHKHHQNRKAKSVKIHFEYLTNSGELYTPWPIDSS